MLWDTDAMSMIILSNVTKFYPNGTMALDDRGVVDARQRRAVERGRRVRVERGGGYES